MDRNTFSPSPEKNRQQIKWNYEWSLKYLWNLFKYFIEKRNSIDVESFSSFFLSFGAIKFESNLMPFFSGTTSLMVDVIYGFWRFVTNPRSRNNSDKFMQIRLFDFLRTINLLHVIDTFLRREVISHSCQNIVVKWIICSLFQLRIDLLHNALASVKTGSNFSNRKRLGSIKQRSST